MTALHERDDLPECIATHEAHRQRLVRQLDAGEIDDGSFARQSSAVRLTLLALREALEIQRGESEPTQSYEFNVREADRAIQVAAAHGELDADLRAILGGDTKCARVMAPGSVVVTTDASSEDNSNRTE